MLNDYEQNEKNPMIWEFFEVENESSLFRIIMLTKTTMQTMQ